MRYSLDEAFILGESVGVDRFSALHLCAQDLIHLRLIRQGARLCCSLLEELQDIEID
jgi:hypothetical protein